MSLVPEFPGHPVSVGVLGSAWCWCRSGWSVAFKTCAAGRIGNPENKHSLPGAERCPAQPAPCYSEGQTVARHQPARGYHLLCTVLWYLSPLRRNYMLWKFLFYCTLVQISPRRATASHEYEWGLELFLRDASARWPSAYPISLQAFEAWSTAFSGHSPFTPLMGFKAT